MVQKADTSTGTWQMSTRTDVRALTRLDCVSLDGDGLYLAGVHETVQMRTGNRPGRLFQTLVVLRASVADLGLREVVWLEQQERSTVVHQVVAGEDLVALLVDAGSVLVFRLDAANRNSRLVLDDTFPDATSIAWVDGEHVLMVSEGGERVVRVSGH